ncbi:hypothetical protein [Nocardia sp. CC227C]|uniref:hypothetical protein n=1 Tax=Nocardia sp. CC227C TaxID=3044562 RepID=UPI00278BD26F|nr:hypothetical protein [Nocardia sp. CC227C]
MTGAESAWRGRDRADDPIGFLHRDDGVWPVGADGWPVTDMAVDVDQSCSDSADRGRWR